MNSLLFMPEQRGYPADYLRGRISGRKRTLITDWERLLASADPLQGVQPAEKSGEGVWPGLLPEYAWIWRQMEPKLRQIFEPYFVLVELQTLVRVLRQREGGESEGAAQLLESSLLDPVVKARLLSGGDTAAVVSSLVPLLGGIERRFFALEEGFRQAGLNGFELLLGSLWLEQQAARRMHPVMETFFSLSIDNRNLVAAAKQLRWGLTEPLPVIRGGRFLPSSLEETVKRGDMAALSEMVRRVTGTDLGKDALDRVEPLLLASLTRRVRRMGRADDEIGPILDYLWRRFMEARNLGILSRGGRLDRDTVRQELVQ